MAFINGKEFLLGLKGEKGDAYVLTDTDKAEIVDDLTKTAISEIEAEKDTALSEIEAKKTEIAAEVVTTVTPEIEAEKDTALSEIKAAKTEILNDIELAADIVQSAGESEAAVMSQKAVTDELSVKANVSGKDIRIESGLSKSMTIKISGVDDLTSAKVKVYGRNLLPYPYVNAGFENRRGITLTDNGDGTFVIDGTLNGSTVYFNLAIIGNKPIHLKKGTYTLKLAEEKHSAIQTVVAFSNVNAMAGLVGGNLTLNVGEVITLNVLEDTEVGISFNILGTETINNLVCRPQIELGEKATDFVPYISPVEYTSNANGEITAAANAPTTTILTENENAKIDVTYYQSISKVFENVRNDVEGINASMNVVGTPKVIDNFQTLDGWKAENYGSVISSMRADTTDFLFGSQSVRFVGSLQKDDFNIKIGDEFRVKFRVNSIDSGASLLLFVADDSTFKNYSAWTLFNGSYSAESLRTNSSYQLGEWVELVLPWSGLENRDFLKVASVIKTIRFRFLGGNGDANIQLIVSEPKKEPKGILSITFDDGCKAMYTKASKMLGVRGLKATAYIIPELVGVSEGCVTEEELVSLKYDYGWDIQGHWGEAMGSYTEDQLKASFESVKTWLKERGLGDCEHFAYASGVYDGYVEKIARRYFKTARTIAGVHVRGIASTKITNPYRILSCSGVSDTIGGTYFDYILERISAISKYGGWLVLTFHDIGDTATGMFCSEAGFARLLDHAIACGVDIKTIAEVCGGN